MNVTLEAMARALFQSWFVDFDPVRAKLDGRPPAALDPATTALFPTAFQDSPLGSIPHGWTATTLGACIGFRSGFSFKSQDWQESGVPVVKIGSVKPGVIDLTQVSYVSEDIAQQAARYRLSTGDMLIGMTGYVGEVGLVPPSDNPPLLNQRVGKFVMPKPGWPRMAGAYPQQGQTTKIRSPLQRSERSFQDRHRSRHVADRLRCTCSQYDVRCTWTSRCAATASCKRSRV